MKAFLTFFALTCLVSSQTPVPIPNLNIANLAGQWYIAFEYSFQINNNQVPTNLFCYQANFNTSTTGGSVSFSMSAYGNNQTLSNSFTLGSQNSIWELSDGQTFDWVAVDPVSGSWGTIANAGSQSAIVLSRTASLSNLVLNAQIALLKGEGFKINSTNTLSFSNVNC